jgi:hypothetical protein
MPQTVMGSIIRPWCRGGDRFLRGLLAGLAVAAPVAADEAAVKAFLVEHLSEGGQYEVGPANVAMASIDLNADGSDEVIVYLMGQYWCGSGGCNAYVLEASGDSYAIRMETSVTQTPIGVLETSTNGWADLFVSVGGGGMPGGQVTLAFDGTAYPDNPTTDGAPGKLKGEVLIDADDRGVPLAD